MLKHPSCSSAWLDADVSALILIISPCSQLRPTPACQLLAFLSKRGRWLHSQTFLLLSKGRAGFALCYYSKCRTLKWLHTSPLLNSILLTPALQSSYMLSQKPKPQKYILPGKSVQQPLWSLLGPAPTGFATVSKALNKIPLLPSGKGDCSWGQYSAWGGSMNHCSLIHSSCLCRPVMYDGHQLQWCILACHGTWVATPDTLLLCRGNMASHRHEKK